MATKAITVSSSVGPRFIKLKNFNGNTQPRIERFVAHTITSVETYLQLLRQPSISLMKQSNGLVTSM